jgi:hypothetical protein
MKNGLVKYELSNNGMEAANCDPECHMLTIWKLAQQAKFMPSITIYDVFCIG